MGISSYLPHANSSLEGELTSWAKDNIQKYEGRAIALSKDVRHLEDQAQTLQQLLDSVKKSIDTMGSVNLKDSAIAPVIEQLKGSGISIPVPPDGILTKDTVVDWAKIVDDDRVRITNVAQRLLSEIPSTLRTLQETLSAIMKIIEQIHAIILLIIRSMGSQGK